MIDTAIITIFNSLGEEIRKFSPERLSEHHSVITVGRSSSCVICLKKCTGVDSTVGREHLTISESEEGWMVEDMGSRNGMYKNDKKVQRALLKAGQTIRFGCCSMVFGAESAESPFTFVWESISGQRGHRSLKPGVNTIGSSTECRIIVQDTAFPKHYGRFLVEGNFLTLEIFENKGEMHVVSPRVVKSRKVKLGVSFAFADFSGMIVENSKLQSVLDSFEPIRSKGFFSKMISSIKGGNRG